MRISIISLILLLAWSNTFCQKIETYYTNIKKDLNWETNSRTWEHSDIIVKLDSGQLIFWKGRSYLPVWESNDKQWPFKEVISRTGDGPRDRPDLNNSFSHVRIISKDSTHSLIHWRYLPDFSGGKQKVINPLNFVDEYFMITNNGHVKRTVKQGNNKIDEWKNDKNLITYELVLTASGIQNEELVGSNPTNSEAEVIQSEIIDTRISSKPVISFRFDEGKGYKTIDAVSGKNSDIIGHKAYWKKGISGTALAFDGYNSMVTADYDFKISNQVSISAWIALGAYPFNWAPIIHQSDFREEGFYFGVGPSGNLSLKLKTNKWKEISSSSNLPLREWVHVAATYDGKEALIYINGKIVKRKKIKGNISQSEGSVIVGRNSHNKFLAIR